MTTTTPSVHRESVEVVVVGHVDHGKSTILGRLLADSGALPDGKLEQVRQYCHLNARPFEFAFLLDALKDEQAQGITIDVARCQLRTPQRNYIFIDAPGHIEFLKNMVTGAARAGAALLVIDAAEGIQENSRRHGVLLSLLGTPQVVVLVNKMDLVSYDQERFQEIRQEFSEFLAGLMIRPLTVVPVSGMEGDNIVSASSRMPWYQGLPLLDCLERLESEKKPVDLPFRMLVQAIYKFTANGDNRRIVAGTVAAGVLNVGDELVFYPSNKRSRVRTIESFIQPGPVRAEAGDAVGFTLDEQIYLARGEMAVRAGEPPPQVSSRIKARLFWLGKSPLVTNREYFLKLGSVKVRAQLEKVCKVTNTSTLQTRSSDFVARHEVGECVLKLDRAVAFDCVCDNLETGRFVVVDEYDIAGGGTVLEALEDQQRVVRQKVLLRNIKWERSSISSEERAERYRHKAALILITGPKDSGKKPIARALERRLFDEGCLVYFLGIGNVLYGVDADIKGVESDQREEHIRRLAEVAHVLLEAGFFLIVTAVELTQADMEIFKTIVEPTRMLTFWVGKEGTTHLGVDACLPGADAVEDALEVFQQMEPGLFRSQ